MAQPVVEVLPFGSKGTLKERLERFQSLNVIPEKKYKEATSKNNSPISSHEDKSHSSNQS